MTVAKKNIVFLCPSAAKKGESNLSCKIARYFEQIGLGSIGSLQTLSTQHSLLPEQQQRLIFINDCKSGCVNVLTHGFEKNNFIVLDIYNDKHSEAVDIEKYVHNRLIPQVREKWNLDLE